MAGSIPGDALRRVGVASAVLFGIAGGVGVYAFLYADGASYLQDDPSACANCHIMSEQFDAWTKGSHHSVATCNDCHAPHSTLPAKLFVKALNGWNHSVAFTTGRFPDPIRITRLNERVTESACRYCHARLIHGIESTDRAEDAVSCIRCHGDVGHDT